AQKYGSSSVMGRQTELTTSFSNMRFSIPLSVQCGGKGTTPGSLLRKYSRCAPDSKRSRSPRSASSVTWMPICGCTHLISATYLRNSKKILSWVSLEDGISRSAREYGNLDRLTPQGRYRVVYRCSGASATRT